MLVFQAREEGGDDGVIRAADERRIYVYCNDIRSNSPLEIGEGEELFLFESNIES